jgi:sugar lactone lactonase YvrE
VVAAQPAPPGDVVAGGLSNPRGLSVDGNDVLIAELGAGRIHRLSPDGSLEVVVSGLPTTTYMSAETGTEEAGGPSAAIAVPGGYVVTIAEAPDSEFQSVYFVSTDGNVTLVADLGAYEQANNTDGDMNLGGEPDVASNPFDIVSDGEGGLLVSNSGANAILHINAEGEVSPYAIFPRIDNPLFPDVGGPTIQQVPTGITTGPDGALYVATLTGFPFPPGGASVYRVADNDGDGDALEAGEVTVYASGLTSATDVAFDGDGHLLVTQFSANMLGENVPGQLVHVAGAGATPRVVVDGLITPTGVTVTSAGRVLVSQEFAGLVSDVTDEIDEDAPPADDYAPPADDDAPPADDDDAADDAPPPASTGQGGLGSGTTLPGTVILLGLIAAIGVAGARRATASR